MEFSMAAFRVTFVIWISVSRCATEFPKVKGPLPNISLANIIEYVKPYVQSLQLGPDTVYKKSFVQRAKSDVAQAIDEKIKELVNFFQDRDFDDTEKDKMLKQGEEGTTIIEFAPKSRINVSKPKNEDKETGTFQTDIRKFKNMRNKIKLALEMEKVAPKTKKLVTKTLDEMIAKLLNSQCKWDDTESYKRDSYLDNITSDSQINCYWPPHQKLSDDKCKELLHNMSLHSPALYFPDLGWLDQLKKFYENAKNHSAVIENILRGITNTISNFRKNTQTFNNNRYKLKCEVIDLDKVKANTVLRRKGSCENFRICSEEFKEFLTDYYKSLNDTAVSVLRNYAAMYVRDVNTDDSEEKISVAATIYNVSDVVEARVSQIFIKQLSKIKLNDNKNTDANVAAIKEYVRTTVRHINKKIKKHLEADLKNLRARLILAVKEDIMINLDVDLGNVESNFLEKICTLFVTCNGEISGSLRKGSSSKNDVKSNSLYVKVQFSLDNEIKDKLSKSGRKLLRDGIIGNITNVTNQSNFIDTSIRNVRVTRTTFKATDFTVKVSSDATKYSKPSKTDTESL